MVGVRGVLVALGRAFEAGCGACDGVFPTLVLPSALFGDVLAVDQAFLLSV